MESSLTDIKAQIGQKKTHLMRENEISGKLSSKNDWYVYLE